MKIGVVFPQTEIGADAGAVRAYAQRVAELGYTHVLAYDHVLGAVHAGREPKLTGPYKETDPFHEPLITYADTSKANALLGYEPKVTIEEGLSRFVNWLRAERLL